MLIYSVGELGDQAAQLALNLGAAVFLVDLRPEARQLALDLSALE